MYWRVHWSPCRQELAVNQLICYLNCSTQCCSYLLWDRVSVLILGLRGPLFVVNRSRPIELVSETSTPVCFPMLNVSGVCMADQYLFSPFLLFSTLRDWSQPLTIFFHQARYYVSLKGDGYVAKSLKKWWFWLQRKKPGYWHHLRISILKNARRILQGETAILETLQTYEFSYIKFCFFSQFYLFCAMFGP